MTEETTTERSWLRLQDGESRQFRILDDQPQIHTLHWVQGVAQDHLDTDCPWCKAGIRASVRYTIPIESPDDSDTWEMASLTWKDLQAVHKAVGGIKGGTIDLSRRGVGRATRYTIVWLGRRAPVASPDVDEAAIHQQGPYVPGRTTLVRSLEEEMAHIAADPQGAAAYVKELCASLEISTEAAVAMFHIENPDVGKDAGAVRILAGVSRMLEQKCEAARAAAVPELDVALSELLGFEIKEGN